MGSVTGQTILVQGGGRSRGGLRHPARGPGRRARHRDRERAGEGGACARARRGGDHDYRGEDVAAAVIALTVGRGVDRIVEGDFGANLAIDQAIIRPYGIIASYSSTRVREPAFPYYALAPKGVTIHVVQGMRSATSAPRPASAQQNGASRCGRAAASDRRACFPLERTAEAHALQESGTAIGKILVASGQPKTTERAAFQARILPVRMQRAPPRS